MSEQLRQSYLEQIQNAHTMGTLMLIAGALYQHYFMAYKFDNVPKMNVINELLARIDHRLNAMKIIDCKWL